MVEGILSTTPSFVTPASGRDVGLRGRPLAPGLHGAEDPPEEEPERPRSGPGTPDSPPGWAAVLTPRRGAPSPDRSRSADSYMSPRGVNGFDSVRRYQEKRAEDCVADLVKKATQTK